MKDNLIRPPEDKHRGLQKPDKLVADPQGEGWRREEQERVNLKNCTVITTEGEGMDGGEVDGQLLLVSRGQLCGVQGREAPGLAPPLCGHSKLVDTSRGWARPH